MDILDNIIFAYANSKLKDGTFIQSDFLDAFVAGPITNTSANGSVPVYQFPTENKFRFCSYEDNAVIEKSITRHWYDVTNKIKYLPSNASTPVYSSFADSSTYHLIFAYLVENTRIIQIFERLIEKYFLDEELAIAEEPDVFNWIQNSERLFFRTDMPRATNIRSLIRPSFDSIRRNAYFRMFGMDLAFGTPENTTVNFFKARAANNQFVPLFEKFLAEIWQGYLNARNTSGPNTTDINVITDLAMQLRELLIARRGPGADYSERNLSREEFSSVLLTSWFAFAISYDSPLMNFLNCESSTIGERLMKIGDKVGIPAHKKSQYLFEMAGAAANILTTVEVDDILSNRGFITDMLSSLNPGTPPSVEAGYMSAFLTVINNWEKATGHRIKNPEASLNGTVKIEQKAAKPALTLN
jgi:hypothetical protein